MAARTEKESGVEDAAAHVRLDLDAHAGDEVWTDAWVTFLQQTMQFADAHEIEVGMVADAHLSYQLLLQLLRLVSQLIGRGQCGRRLVVQQLSLRGQPHPARAALEQLDAQFFLERLDLRTDRRLAGKQALRRTGQITLVGHLDERIQLVELHRDLRASGPRQIEADCPPRCLSRKLKAAF